MENKFKINELERVLENELDFDFSVSEKNIKTIEEFNTLLMSDFKNGKRKIFYRGERINSTSRPLVPTMFRDRNAFFNSSELFVTIDCNYLLDYYKSHGNYFSFYNYAFGKAKRYRLYEFCAFSQHYFDLSPFIDFTKSIYVALSFALKGKKEFDDDCVIYTVEINDFDNYTNDIITAECWLNNFSVNVYNSPENISKSVGFVSLKAIREAVELSIKTSSPKAKLIDIPTNDLMKFQQGVFLLLTDYSLVYKSYLTKNIRNDFNVTKYVISKDICPYLVDLINEEAPWYSYDCLLDVKKGIQRASNNNM